MYFKLFLWIKIIITILPHNAVNKWLEFGQSSVNKLLAKTWLE